MIKSEKVSVSDFGGLYMRGDDDTIPPGHFRVCTNFTFDRGELRTRGGAAQTYQFNFRARKAFLGTTERTSFFLILDDAGNIHRDDGSIIMTFDYPTASFDFSAINLYNRVYLSPSVNGFDDNHEFIWVYSGTGTARLAGGLKPTSGVTAVDSATAGDVSKGVHKIAVCYETDTGFRTPPSVLASFTAAGDLSVDVSSIPLGPAGTVARYLLCTKAGEEELFFVPDTGYIEDNTTTSITVNFADTDLVSSADYLNDIYERIPAGSQLINYAGRLAVVGSDHLVRLSYIQDPETFSKVDGFLAIPSEGYKLNPPVAAWVLRDTLYISKFPGVYSTQDNGSDAVSDWPVSVVDESVGCYPNGIGSYTAGFSGRNTSDYEIILTQQGIMLFDGVFRRPALTYKIEELWRKIVEAEISNVAGTNYYFWRMTVTHDVVHKKLYVNCNTSEVDPITNLQWFCLHADYSKGLDSQNICWSMWAWGFDAGGLAASVITMALHPIDNKYALRIMGFYDTKMWTLDDDLYQDGDVFNTAVLESGFIDTDPGTVHFFLGIQVRGKGSSTVALQLTDGSAVNTPVALTISSTYTRDYLRLCNFTAEKARYRLSGGCPYTINRLDFYCKSMFPQRPQL
jgi:hypothetical protein